MSATATRWEPVIGLEVHVQLATRSKLFCRCEARFGAPPNTLVCAVCTAQPGTLPVLNAEALRLGVLAGLALGCEVAPRTKFDRKNYFYPDLPKGYQISQYDRPLCTGGALSFEAPDGAGGRVARRVRLVRAHLEEDSGKIVHPAGMDLSLVDLNRAGVPLLEIVSAPDIRSPDEASAYLQALRRTLRFAGVSECDMEKGSFRCDANVSLRPAGSSAFGTRCEIKNLNSFRFVAQALAAEMQRQATILDAGGRIVQSTLAFDPDRLRTAPVRTKEEANDYRYFPEPDLPEFAVDPAWVAELKRTLEGRDPAHRRQRWLALGVAAQHADALLEEPERAEYFEAVVAAAPGVPAGSVAGVVLVDALRLANERRLTLPELAVTPARLGELLALAAGGALSVQAMRTVIVEMEARPGAPARAVAEALDLLQVSDAGQLERVVAEVLQREAEMVARYRSGKTGLFNALLGSVMKASGGRANPATVRELLQRALGSA
jgi:aspartyl-tRNA(Asn)/glutamyl-tRNA(Gln) amidotransferase subunit B